MKLWFEIEYSPTGSRHSLGIQLKSTATEAEIDQAFDAARESMKRYLEDKRASTSSRAGQAPPC